MTQKRTVAEWRSFIELRARSETTRRPGLPQGGPIISGAEAQSAAAAIARLSATDRKKLNGMFQAFPKYQVLSVLISKNSPLLRSNEAEVLEIVEGVAAVDFEKNNAAARFPGNPGI